MHPLRRRDGRPLRIGHRGAAALAPENTLAAFRAALDAGVDLIEFDALQLRDGDLVVAHSHDLHEVSHGAARGTLKEMTLEEIRRVCPQLPTLDEALGFFTEKPEVGAHLDLKSPGAAAAAAAALRRFGLLEQDARQLLPRPRPAAARRPGAGTAPRLHVPAKRASRRRPQKLRLGGRGRAPRPSFRHATPRGLPARTLAGDGSRPPSRGRERGRRAPRARPRRARRRVDGRRSRRARPSRPRQESTPCVTNDPSVFVSTLET